MNKSTPQAKLDAEKEAIQGCEEQVLNDIGFIQPFAYLLAFQQGQSKFTHASKNIENCLGLPIGKILDQAIDAVLPKEIVHSCSNACAHATITSVREYLGCLENKCGQFEVYAHKKKDFVIIELQAVDHNASIGISMLDKVQRVLGRLNTNTKPQDLFESAVIEIKQLSGFDRVKMYQFLPDGAGEVVAEEKEPDVDSFLGLRFPAFDIPKAARELYAQTPLRLIPSVTAEQIDILSLDENARELDLSLAISRGAVPVHMMYLQNMGVQASMSIPVVIEGKMWGLFACHHYSEYVPSSDIISSCEILGNTISMMLAAMIQSKRTARMEQCSTLVNKLIVPDESALGFTAYWESASTELSTLIDCDGVALVSADSCLRYGECPSESAINEVIEGINNKNLPTDSDTSAFVVESITTHFPDLDCGKTAGFLAIAEPAASFKYLLFFRKEAQEDIHWAGKPDKHIEKEAESYRLNPRGSFAEYVEKNANRCLAFNSDELIVAEALSEALNNMMSNVSTHTKNRDRLGLMVRELNHRVRNILALITSIVSQSRNDSHSLEQFVESLESRIQALSETHKLLTEFDWQAIHISLLFERALSPYIAKTQKRISLNGEHASLPPELASLFALVMHELASNALKYGALSVPEGSVNLSWHVDKKNLHVKWKETNGPTVIPPSRIGFGTTLIKEALSYEFDADCKLSFLPTGVEANFSMPYINTKVKIELAVTQSVPITSSAHEFSVLVLEDDYIISKDMCSMLKRFGARTTDAASTLKKAHMMLDSNTYDIAILDANIRGEFSGEIANRLDQLQTPYVFVTGYGSKDQALHNTKCIDILTKPVNEDELYALLRVSKVIKQ